MKIKIDSYSFTEEDRNGKLTVVFDCGLADTDESLDVLKNLQLLLFELELASDEAPKEAIPKEVVEQNRYAVRMTSDHSVIGDLQYYLVVAQEACIPGSEVYDAKAGKVVYTCPKDGPRPPTVADQLAQVAAIVTTNTKPPASNAAPLKRKAYKVGERYDGVEIVKVKLWRPKGVGFLYLKDEVIIKYDLATSNEIERKVPESEGTGVYDPKDVDIVPTSRCTGALAPDVDPPVDTPSNEAPPEWMAEVMGPKSVREVVETALKHMTREELDKWAIRYQHEIPALAKVTGHIGDRIKRVLSIGGTV